MGPSSWDTSTIFHFSEIKSFSPAILPLAKLRRPSITHPDFHAANVFVSTDSNTPSVTGVIDWQNATVRPLFETVLPSVFDVSATDVPHITLAGDFEDPLLPSNIDELDEDDQTKKKSMTSKVPSDVKRPHEA